MDQINLAKFSSNPKLHYALLVTGNETLIFASLVDAVWGVKLSKMWRNR